MVTALVSLPGLFLRHRHRVFRRLVRLSHPYLAVLQERGHARGRLSRRVVALGVVREHRLREEVVEPIAGRLGAGGTDIRFGLCEPQIGGRRQVADGDAVDRGTTVGLGAAIGPHCCRDRRRQQDRPHRASAPADRPRGRSISSSTNTPSTGRRRWSGSTPGCVTPRRGVPRGRFRRR